MADTSTAAPAIRAGTRTSELARIQTRTVIEALGRHGVTSIETVAMSTTGDRVLDQPLSQIGEKSLFTKELELALEAKTVDFVVHSLKDLPTVLPPGMIIGAVFARDSPDDVLLVNPKHAGTVTSLDQLPANSIIGTSSLRRTSQLRARYPQLIIKDIRGNLNTRLRKLDEGDPVNNIHYDGIILAQAGLDRMGWQSRAACCFNGPEDLYAVGQGALAVECREGDEHILTLLKPLNHQTTRLCVSAERAFMRKLEGGCSTPLGVRTSITDLHLLSFSGRIFSLDGATSVGQTICGVVETERDAEALGVRLAETLLSAGGQEIMDSLPKKH